MKYVILCGGDYVGWETPRQLLRLPSGETIVERTIRLLNEAGIADSDIFLTATDKRFYDLGYPIIEHENKYNGVNGRWLEAFPAIFEKVCYIFGDVIFSPDAIKKIVEMEEGQQAIHFFGSAPPFSDIYPKSWAEPFGFKVFNPERFLECISETYWRWENGHFRRNPIAWELWWVIGGKDTVGLNCYDNYDAIRDYTCDVDHVGELERMIAFWNEKGVVL